ncbi:hypothetical protein AHF37_11251 [Paragonimus kellicotti]|nr:hypothetical protein AHF37_11251 [Paragonimus kellicotti]
MNHGTFSTGDFNPYTLIRLLIVVTVAPIVFRILPCILYTPLGLWVCYLGSLCLSPHVPFMEISIYSRI